MKPKASPVASPESMEWSTEVSKLSDDCIQLVGREKIETTEVSSLGERLVHLTSKDPRFIVQHSDVLAVIMDVVERTNGKEKVQVAQFVDGICDTVSKASQELEHRGELELALKGYATVATQSSSSPSNVYPLAVSSLMRMATENASSPIGTRIASSILPKVEQYNEAVYKRALQK